MTGIDVADGFAATTSMEELSVRAGSARAGEFATRGRFDSPPEAGRNRHPWPQAPSLTDDGTAQLFTRLYVRGVPVAARREGFDDILGTVGGDKVMLYIAKAPRWPDDPVGLILADSTFNDYKLVQDPYSMSKYDATAIPPERQAMFGCARGTP